MTDTSAALTTLREPVLYADKGRHGMLFLPTGNIRSRVLLITPLFEEKRCAHRALTTCAATMAGAGAAVLMPDLYGTGNSGGMPAEIGLAQWHDDVYAADAFLQTHSRSPLTLIGCRAGALLACCEPGLNTQRLLLWQPVLSGKSYLRQLRTRRMIQDSITGDKPAIGQYEIEGQHLAETLFRELEALNLPDEAPSGEIRLLQCSFNATLLTEYTRLAARWGDERVRTRCLVSEPFWNPHSPGSYAELAAAVTEEALC